MADVQYENGYTKIANELLEVVMQQKFNGTQFKIILSVLRYTYGFNRKEHEMSLTFIASSTGVHKQTVRNELERLIERNIITVVKESGFNNSRVIKLNKDYDKWEGLQSVSRLTVSETNPLTVSETTNTTVSESAYSTVSESTDQERNIKEKNKESIPYKQIIDYLNEKSGSKFKHSAAGNKKRISARWNEGNRLDDFLKVIDYCVDEWSGKTFRNGKKGDEYLQPSTLFNEKFDERLNKAEAHEEKNQPKKFQKTAEQLEAKRIRDLIATYELGLDYWENIDGSPEIYHEAVKELKELGQL